MIHVAVLRAALIPAVLVFLADVSAQQSPAATKAASLELSDMQSALQLRSQMADAVAQGAENSAAALVRLKKEISPTGLMLNGEADFAFAAIDIGRRLIVAGKSGEAEKFFREAEKYLDVLVMKTSDAAARDKADYLQKLALIRSQYLGHATQAKQNLDEAVRLQPEDKHLQQARDAVANEQAGVFSDKLSAKGGT